MHSMLCCLHVEHWMKSKRTNNDRNKTPNPEKTKRCLRCKAKQRAKRKKLFWPNFSWSSWDKLNPLEIKLMCLNHKQNIWNTLWFPQRHSYMNTLWSPTIFCGCQSGRSEERTAEQRALMHSNVLWPCWLPRVQCYTLAQFGSGTRVHPERLLKISTASLCKASKWSLFTLAISF